MKIGGRYFYRKNDGLQNQAVLYVLDKLDGEPRLLIDPNTWSKDGTIALGDTSVSQDGKYPRLCRFGGRFRLGNLEGHGRRRRQNSSRRNQMGEVQQPPRGPQDGKGFYYSRYPEPKKDEKFQSLNKNQQVFYHRLGTQQSDDVLAYQPARPAGMGLRRRSHRRWPLSRHLDLERNRQPQPRHLSRPERTRRQGRST